MKTEIYLNVVSLITEYGQVDIVSEDEDYFLSITTNCVGTDELAISKSLNPHFWDIIKNELKDHTFIEEMTDEGLVFLGIDNTDVVFSISAENDVLQTRVAKDTEFAKHLTRIINEVKRSIKNENRSKETLCFK